MKNGLFTTLLLLIIISCSACQKTETFKVLQFNLAGRDRSRKWV